jgi:uncharacterized protein
VERQAGFRIDRDGVWYHHGTRVQRAAMVRLFAGMLRRHGAGYVLQTPEQRIAVSVEDAPFVVTDMQASVDGGTPRIWMSTSLGERYLLGHEHPLYLRETGVSREVRAYLTTRDGIPALVHRNVFYRLAESARLDDESGKAGVFSDGMFFPLE